MNIALNVDDEIKHFIDTLEIYAYGNICNSSEILQYMIINQIDNNYNKYIIIDLELVVSYYHLFIAMYKSYFNKLHNNMKTKFYLSEVIYQLSSMTKINESLELYKLKLESNMIAIIILEKDEIITSLLSMIQGDILNIRDISNSKYLHQIRTNNLIQHYRILPKELEIGSLEDAIITKIATKDI